MPDKFQNRYRIASARLSTWDYSSNGAYFITVCTANREHYFGKIINGVMQLSKAGEIANDCWYKIPAHFPHLYVDEFVVMPNHIHGILLIEKPYWENNAGFGNAPAETGHGVETGHALSLQDQINEGGSDVQAMVNSAKGNEFANSKHPRFRNQGKNTISSMVGSFKSAVTKKCHENELAFKWQSRFHDRIIRNTNEFFFIRNYINNNIGNWKEDKFFS